jgi:membrane-bound hydrogenase subunit beta
MDGEAYTGIYECRMEDESMTEEKLKQDLVSRFPELADRVTVQRARRLWVDAPIERFRDIFGYCTGELGSGILLTITGLDEGPATFGVIYHMARPDGIVVNVKTHPPKDNPVLESISPRFPSAEAYERELVDLLGIRVTGLPEGPRYPLPDGWPEGQYPLRKDWTGPPAGPGAAAEQGGSHA